MRLKSMSGAGGPTMVEVADASLSSRMNALQSARGTVAPPPRVQKCSCDGGGWIVTLDRDRYQAPANAGMLRFTRCICLDNAPRPALSGGAGAV